MHDIRLVERRRMIELEKHESSHIAVVVASVMLYLVKTWPTNTGRRSRSTIGTCMRRKRTIIFFRRCLHQSQQCFVPRFASSEKGGSEKQLRKPTRSSTYLDFACPCYLIPCPRHWIRVFQGCMECKCPDRLCVPGRLRFERMVWGFGFLS